MAKNLVKLWHLWIPVLASVLILLPSTYTMVNRTLVSVAVSKSLSDTRSEPDTALRLQNVVEQLPSDIRILRQLGMLYAAANKHEALIDLYQTIGMEKLDWSASLQLGKSYAAVGQNENAVSTWAMIGADRYFVLYNDWEILRAIYAWQGQHTPDSVTFMNLGRANRELGDVAAAQSAFETAVTMDSENYLARFDLAQLLFEQGVWQEAGEHFLWLVEYLAQPVEYSLDSFEQQWRQDIYHDAVFSMAYVHKALGNWSEAEQWYLLAQSLWPTEATSYGHLSDVYLQLRRPEASLQQIGSLIATGNARPQDYAWRQGQTYLALGQPESAIKAFVLAIEAEPQRAVLYEWMGDSLCANNQQLQAETAYAKAVELGLNLVKVTCE